MARLLASHPISTFRAAYSWRSLPISGTLTQDTINYSGRRPMSMRGKLLNPSVSMFSSSGEGMRRQGETNLTRFSVRLLSYQTPRATSRMTMTMKMTRLTPHLRMRTRRAAWSKKTEELE